MSSFLDVAVVALWARSYGRHDTVTRVHEAIRPRVSSRETFALGSGVGRWWVVSASVTDPKPAVRWLRVPAWSTDDGRERDEVEWAKQSRPVPYWGVGSPGSAFVCTRSASGDLPKGERRYGNLSLGTPYWAVVGALLSPVAVRTFAVLRRAASCCAVLRRAAPTRSAGRSVSRLRLRPPRHARPMLGVLARAGRPSRAAARLARELMSRRPHNTPPARVRSL